MKLLEKGGTTGCSVQWPMTLLRMVLPLAMFSVVGMVLQIRPHPSKPAPPRCLLAETWGRMWGCHLEGPYQPFLNAPHRSGASQCPRNCQPPGRVRVPCLRQQRGRVPARSDA